MGLFEKPKLDNARKVERHLFIDPDDEEFKETMKSARTTLELPMEAAMPCKVRKLGHGDAHGENKPNTRKSKHACIVEARKQGLFLSVYVDGIEMA